MEDGTGEIRRRHFSLDLPNNGGVSIAMIGASRAGKTSLLKYLWKEYFSDKITIMYSQNAHAKIYHDLPNKVLICPDYYPDLINDIHIINSRNRNKFNFCLISDDCVGSKVKNDPMITKALTIMRNTGLTSIWSFQSSILMNSVGRSNCNYIMIFKQNTPKEIKRVIDEYLDQYLPMGLTMTEKIHLFHNLTKDYNFFFIDTIKGVCSLCKLSKEQLET